MSARVSPRRKRSRMATSEPLRRVESRSSTAAGPLFDFLRAEADRLQHLAVAERAVRRNRLAQAAVVADQQAGPPVHGQCHAAVAATEFVPALAAEQIRRVAAPIDQDDDLLA